jgi:hypothetical protein
MPPLFFIFVEKKVSNERILEVSGKEIRMVCGYIVYSGVA